MALATPSVRLDAEPQNARPGVSYPRRQGCPKSPVIRAISAPIRATDGDPGARAGRLRVRPLCLQWRRSVHLRTGSDRAALGSLVWPRSGTRVQELAFVLQGERQLGNRLRRLMRSRWSVAEGGRCLVADPFPELDASGQLGVGQQGAFVQVLGVEADRADHEPPACLLISG